MPGLLLAPDGPRLLYVMAHGAGAGMRHPFLEAVAQALFARDIATFRYEFPYREKGAKRPDPPAVAMARVREAVAEAAHERPGVPLIAGGKSFGGRMTSGAQAASPLEGVRGLAFLGFPLHPPGKPGPERAAHLEHVDVPMLFLQGTRDEFAKIDLLKPLVQRLGSRATLHLVDGGDHSFKVPKRPPADVVAELADAIRGWAAKL